MHLGLFLGPLFMKASKYRSQVDRPLSQVRTREAQESLRKELETCSPRPLDLALAPKDHINIRILQKMISGIRLLVGLGTSM